MSGNKTRDQTLSTGNRYHLPLPTGPYHNIGYYDVMTGSNAKDGVLARILYPALNQLTNTRDRYAEWPNWFPHPNYRTGYANVMNVWWSPAVRLITSLFYDTYIPILQNDEPLNSGESQFPVIIFSHGLASCRTTYSDITYELASYGFIVVVLEHRDESACASFYPTGNQTEPFKWMSYKHYRKADNELELRKEQLDQRVTDIKEAIDILKAFQNGQQVENLLEPKMDNKKFVGMFDLNNITVMGHSFGSATAIRALQDIESAKLAVCLDSWMFPIKDMNAKLITKPILFVNMELFQFEKNLLKMNQFVSTDGKNIDFRKVFTIKNAKHTDQSDIPFVLNSWLRMIFRFRSNVDPFIVHDLTTALTLEFIVENLGIKLNKNKNSFIDKYRENMFEGIEGEGVKIEH